MAKQTPNPVVKTPPVKATGPKPKSVFPTQTFPDTPTESESQVQTETNPDTPPADTAVVHRPPTAPRTMTKAKGATAKPAFIPSTIVSAIDHAGGCRTADLKHFFGVESDTVRITPLVITPTLARTLLTGNVNNRPLSKANVKALSSRMANGQWNWDVPIVIILDTEGRVHNGQHCLNALIETEAIRTSSQELLAQFAEYGMETELAFRNGVVIRGLPPEVANHWDRNRVRSHSDIIFRQNLLKNENRTPGDLVRMSGIVATTTKFAWLRLVLGKKQRFSTAFGHEDMVEFIEYYPDLIGSVEFCYDEEKSTPKGAVKLSKRLTLPQASLLHWMMSNAGYGQSDDADEQASIDAQYAEKADLFIKQIASGGVAKGTDVVSVLCHFLGGRQSGSGNAYIEATFDAAIVAASAFLNGESITPADLIVPPSVQCTDENGNLLYMTTTGVTGYTDDKGTFHWVDEHGKPQTWTKSTMAKAQPPVELTQVTMPSYPHLGGLDVPPSDDVDIEETTDEESEASE